MKTNIRVIINTPEKTFFGKNQLLDKSEVLELEALVQNAVVGNAEYYEFELETEGEVLFLSKKKALKSSFIIRKK